MNNSIGEAYSDFYKKIRGVSEGGYNETWNGPLYFTPGFAKGEKSLLPRVNYGNSGLSIIFHDEYWELDYVPESYNGSPLAGEFYENKEMKYASIYGGAMHELVRFWRHFESFELPKEITRLNIAGSKNTNSRMHDFRKNLFRVKNSEEPILEKTRERTACLLDEPFFIQILKDNRYDFKNQEKYLDFINNETFYSYFIHLDRLSSNAIVMERLKRLRNRCLSQEYTMDYTY